MAGEKPERPPLLGSEFGEALMAHGEDREKKLQEVVGELQAEMEAVGALIRDLVLAQPPTGLLGYLWSQFFMGALTHHRAGFALLRDCDFGAVLRGLAAFAAYARALCTPDTKALHRLISACTPKADQFDTNHRVIF